MEVVFELTLIHSPQEPNEIRTSGPPLFPPTSNVKDRNTRENLCIENIATVRTWRSATRNAQQYLKSISVARIYNLNEKKHFGTLDMSKGNSKDGERDAAAHSVLDLVGVCVVLPRSHSKFASSLSTLILPGRIPVRPRPRWASMYSVSSATRSSVGDDEYTRSMRIAGLITQYSIESLLSPRHELVHRKKKSPINAPLMGSPTSTSGRISNYSVTFERRYSSGTRDVVGRKTYSN